jgi:hypothetical protein
MPNKTLSQLRTDAPAAALTGTEPVETVQGGSSVAAIWSQVLAYIRGQLTDADVPAAVATVAGASATAALADRGVYHRWTATGAKTLTVDTTVGGAAGEYHHRNCAASGDLTIVASGVTINVPKGGTLVLEPGDAVTLKRVGTNVFDLLGSTKAA